MVRKKVYTKEQILNASREILIKDGFSGITARNVADEMGISTQPIYLEFKNMQDLKVTLLTSIHDYLETDYYSNKRTENTMIDFGLNFIDFARKNRGLYLALYVDNHDYSKELKDLAFSSFHKAVMNSEYQSIEKEKLETLHLNAWIVATGAASLSISGILEPTDQQLTEIFHGLIKKFT